MDTRSVAAYVLCRIEDDSSLTPVSQHGDSSLFLLATKNTPMRFCEACQTPLPAKPRHKRYCNATCRSNARNHR
jgi:hypothetical protein